MLVHTVLKLIDDAITATYDLVGRQFGHRHLVDVQTAPGSLSRARHAFEHVLLVAAHERRPRGARHRNLRQRLGRGAREQRRLRISLICARLVGWEATAVQPARGDSTRQRLTFDVLPSWNT